MARAAAVTVAVAVTGGAGAEPGVSLRKDPAPAGDAGFWVAAPDARGHGAFRVRVSFGYARDPLVLVSRDQSTRRVVASESSVDLGLSYALFQRLLVYANLPLSQADSDDSGTDRGVTLPAPASGVALADARLGVRFHALGPLEDGLQLGSAAELWLPTGDEAHYNGDGQARARLSLLGGGSYSRFQGSIQLSFGFRGSERLPGILPTRVGRSIGLGVSARAPVDSAARFWIGPELHAEFGVGDGAKLFDPRSTVAHALLALRVRPFLGAFEVGAAFGPGLGQGAGSADGRGLLFVGWSPETPPPPPDADADGVPDESDICLNLPGEPSHDPLMHGCPEAPLDSDGDSIPDGFDACPREPGEPTGVRKTQGCPKAAVRVPAPSTPSAPPAATVAERQISISEQVQFETGTAVLRGESTAILSAVAAALAEHPEIELIEIQGHTDDTGTPELNQRLSHDRAAAVLSWLVAHGIAASRLRPVGYGQSRPLSQDTSEAGRAMNRRVEFRIVTRRSKAEGAR
jgi:outer membrane protein OmpA-like peptidoglycan-associated protein